MTQAVSFLFLFYPYVGWIARLVAIGRTHGNDFAALVGECLGARLGDIARHGADLELRCGFGVGEDRGDDGAALSTCCAEDGDDFLCC